MLIFLGFLLVGFIIGGVWFLGYIIDYFFKIDLFDFVLFNIF